MQLAIGIDIGWSARSHSFGLVILDRKTRTIATGTQPLVANAATASGYLLDQLASLAPAQVVFCVDGPFAPAADGKARLVERLFMSGPFAAVPRARGLRLRVMPAPTRPNSPFLRSTSLVVETLVADGYTVASISGTTLSGDIVEIFPTLFMASLLPPHAYDGARSSHSDDLWLKLIGVRGIDGASPKTASCLSCYRRLIHSVEAAPRAQLHDLRAAAICAIAADWYAAAAPGSATQNACTFIGSTIEHGFLLPPARRMDARFRNLLTKHWKARGAPPLLWLT